MSLISSDLSAVEKNSTLSQFETAAERSVDIVETSKLPALEQWCVANVPGFAGPVGIRKFRNGHSNPTYMLETPRAAYVLRRQPWGGILPTAHAVDREFTVTSPSYS